MTVDVVAGVDSSTSACKVELRDAATGRLISSGRAAHPECHPPRSEQEPASWERALAEAMGQAGLDPAAAGRMGGLPQVRKGRLVGLAVAAQQHGMVVLGAGDEVLRPAKLWNDTESAPDSAELVSRLGPQAWADACGSVPVPALTITKLRWLRRSEPEVFRLARSVMLPHDWLTFRLTGLKVTDRGDASGTGYFSPAQGRYRVDLLELVDGDLEWEPLLPLVLGPSDPAGTWGRSEVVVGPGTGDNMAAALGVGARPGDLVLSLGTSGTAFTVSEEPTADGTGTVAGFADATGRFLPLVCTLNATKVTDAVRRLLGCDNERFDQLALQAGPGSGGLVMVPFLDGERTPNLPGASGAITGIRSDIEACQLARAAVEGVVCNLLAGAERLPAPRPPRRVLLVGGGARSAAYRQVVADLTSRPVLSVLDEELVARGAALQAAAVASGRTLEEVISAWPARQSLETEPAAEEGRAAEVLAAYRDQVARLSSLFS